MELLILIYSIIILVIAFMYTKRTYDLLNPLILFYCPLILNYTTYFFLYKNEYQISFLTNFIFFLGLTAFGIGYFIIQITYSNRFRIKKNTTQNNNSSQKGKVKVNNVIRNFFMAIGIIGFIIGIYEFFYYGTHGSGEFLINVRRNYIYGSGVSPISQYGTMILFVTSCVYLYQYLQSKDSYKKKKMKKVAIILIVLSIVATFFSVARTGMLQYILAYTYIFLHNNLDQIRNKIKKFVDKKSIKKMYKKILLSAIVLLIIFVILGILLGKAGTKNILDKNFFVYKYIGYSLIAFDMYIKDFPSTTSGYYVLGPLGKVLFSLGIFNDTYIINFGAPTGSFNVYSYISSPYMDFGMLGVLIVMFFIGMFVAIIYNKSCICGGMWTIFYANYIYAITIAFYAYQFSNTYYVYLIVTLVAMKLFTRKKYENIIKENI